MKTEDIVNAYTELTNLRNSWKLRGFENTEIVTILTAAISSLAITDDVPLSDLKTIMAKLITDLYPLQAVTYNQKPTTIEPENAYSELVDLKNSWKERGLDAPTTVGVLAALIARFGIGNDIPLTKFLDLMRGLFIDLYAGEVVNDLKPIKDNLPS